MDPDRPREALMYDITPLAESPLAIDVRAESGVTVVHMGGELDVSSRQAFASALCPLLRPGERVRVDLSAVRLLDAGTIGLAMTMQADARASGAELTFVNAQGVVARVLAILDPDSKLSETLVS